MRGARAHRPDLRVLPSPGNPPEEEAADAPCCAAAAQIEEACVLFWIAAEGYAAHLPTDWGYVASKMYEAITDAPDAPAEPEEAWEI